MSREDLYNIIEEFLAGKLDDDARAAFEQRMSSEPDLAQEVELHRKIQEELGNAPKRNLRTKLDSLSKEFTLKESEEKVVLMSRYRNMRRVIAIAAAILLFGIAIWFFVLQKPKENKIVEDPDKMEQTGDSTPVKENLPQNETQFAQDEPQKENQDTPDNTPDSAPQQEFLASTDPNVLFENMIQQNGIQRIYKFTIANPRPAQKISLQDGEINLIINGKLDNADPQENSKFQFSVFENRSTSYDLAQAKQVIDLPMKKVLLDEDDEDEEVIAFAGPAEYSFKVEEKLRLEPGLYYYTISLDSNTKVLHAGKFQVIK